MEQGSSPDRSKRKRSRNWSLIESQERVTNQRDLERKEWQQTSNRNLEDSLPSRRRDEVGGLRTVTDVRPSTISGQRLDRLLEMLSSSLATEIKEKESLRKNKLMREIKRYFCIGINNVTRTLERMPNVESEVGDEVSYKGKEFVHLQVVLVASDVHPRLLVSHLPVLAWSRKVPLLFISGGNGTGSLRLGKVLNVRTAMAVGVKKGESTFNAIIESFLNETF